MSPLASHSWQLFFVFSLSVGHSHQRWSDISSISLQIPSRLTSTTHSPPSTAAACENRVLPIACLFGGVSPDVVVG